MSDIIDQANRLAEWHREKAILESKKPSVQPSILNVRQGVRHCVDCDEEIPPARIKAIPNASLCAPCTAIREAQR